MKETSSELIAKFHGWIHHPTPQNKGKGYWSFIAWGKANWPSQSFRYHASWDWLMPVVDKVNNIDAPDGMIDELSTALINVDIKTAYRILSNIITWYNNQTHEQETKNR